MHHHPSLTILKPPANSFSRPAHDDLAHHLEQLSYTTLLASASAHNPASAAFLLDITTPECVYCLDEAFATPDFDTAQTVALLADKRAACGPWVTRIVSVMANVSEESRGRAVVWLHYHSKGNGQAVPRENVTRWTWRFVESAGIEEKGRWKCCRNEYLRGPCMDFLDWSTLVTAEEEHEQRNGGRRVTTKMLPDPKPSSCLVSADVSKQLTIPFTRSTGSLSYLAAVNEIARYAAR
jgi:hypothetical protein